MSVLDNAIQNCFTLSVKIKKVWTNASPNSSFGAQTINLPTKNVLMFIVNAIYDTGRQDGTTSVITKRGLLAYPTSNNMFRTATKQEDGILFGAGYLISPYGTNVADNTRMIPQEIYAVEVMPDISGGGIA